LPETSSFFSIILLIDEFVYILPPFMLLQLGLVLSSKLILQDDFCKSLRAVDYQIFLFQLLMLVIFLG